MDKYHPQKVFSSIDTHGRYAYAKQPEIAHWNLSWLAQALLPLMDDVEAEAINKAQQALAQFSTVFDASYQHLMAEKIGFTESSDEVNQLFSDLLQLMAEQGSDYTLTFRVLGDQLAAAVEPGLLGDIYHLPDAFAPWLKRWYDLLDNDNINTATAHARMKSVNPVYIPRNHQIEAAIQQATQGQDFTLFHQLMAVLANPFEYREESKQFALPPEPEQEVKQTFCGT